MRLKRGKYQAAKEGVWQVTGKTPFGWRSVRINGMWTLEPGERHGVLMRIYDLLESGENYCSIARILNEEGEPTPRGGAYWRHQTVKAIAENPVNCGMNRYGARVMVREFDKETFEVRKTKKNNPNPQITRGLWFGNGTLSIERFERLVGKSVASARLHKGVPRIRGDDPDFNALLTASQPSNWSSSSNHWMAQYPLMNLTPFIFIGSSIPLNAIFCPVGT